MNREIWKGISGYPGYFVSNLGRVRSPKGKLLKQATRLGYKRANLLSDGKMKSHSVHLLVLKAFIGPPPKGKETHHINHDSLDNRLSNLAYVTHSENVQIAYDSGRKIPKIKPGEEHLSSRLTNKDILEIREMSKCFTQTFIAKTYNISISHVSGILKRRTWKHI